MKNISFLLILFLLTNCRSSDEHEIEDVGKIEHFSVKNRGGTIFDNAIRISVEGKVDGTGYLYMKGTEKEILPPEKATFIIRIHKGNIRLNQTRTITLLANQALHFVYVPITAKEGDLTVKVKF